MHNHVDAVTGQLSAIDVYLPKPCMFSMCRAKAKGVQKPPDVGNVRWPRVVRKT